MASKLERFEIVLTVPVELTRDTSGLSMDLGGSVFKFVYRSKEDLQQVQNKDAKIGHLHLVSFSRSELAEALEYIRQNAAITRTGDEPTSIYTTGVGCTEFGKLICDKLNVKLENLTEFDCAVKSFMYLALKVPASEIIEPFIEEATVEPIAFMMEQMKLVDDIKDQNLSQIQLGSVNFDLNDAIGRAPVNVVVPLSDSESYPCVLAVCGSAFGFLQVKKDGTFTFPEGSNRGGMSFIGIGSLLTGSKTFDELIELASRGNPHNVDLYTDSFSTEGASEGDNSIYSTLGKHKNPSLVFCFGKTVGATLSDFKREDLARSWLQYVVQEAVQSVRSYCLRVRVKRVFFGGSFCTSRLVRETITKEFCRLNIFTAMLAKDDVVQFDFLKPGSHLGALGALINEIDKFIGK